MLFTFRLIFLSLTWREQDQELLKIIDVALWSLSSRSTYEPLTSS